MSKIILNAIECNACKVVVISTNRHDYRACKCGKVAVDGGLDYLRHLGDKGSYTDLSIVKDERGYFRRANWKEDNEGGT